MKNAVVARNYAEALLALAVQANAVERFGDLLDAVAGAVASDPTVKAVLMSPRVTKAAKQRMLANGLKGVASDNFIGFLQAVVLRGRQGMFTGISEAYQALADQHFNRVHASVVTAREADEALKKLVAERLGKVMGKNVVAHFRSDPDIIGGLVVRMGDRTLDGSIRRRLQTLKSKLLHG